MEIRAFRREYKNQFPFQCKNKQTNVFLNVPDCSANSFRCDETGIQISESLSQERAITKGLLLFLLEINLVGEEVAKLLIRLQSCFLGPFLLGVSSRVVRVHEKFTEADETVSP